MNAISVLITGGTGFIGSHISRLLLRDGERPIAFDPMPSNVMDQVLTAEEKAAIAVVHGDVTSLRDLSVAIREHQVTKVIHLASLLNPASDENPPLALRVNVNGQMNVLEAARIFNLQKVLWASSIVVFGPRAKHDHHPLPNDAPHFPMHNYAATKSYDEFISTLYRKKWSVDVTGLRLTLVYGPGRVRGATAFVNELIHMPALGRPARVMYGDDVVDWQYVVDVARLFVKCLSVGWTEVPVFNTQFDPRSIREAGEYVKSCIPTASIEYESGKMDDIVFQLDDSLLQREIGFRPEYPMERGIREVIDFVRARAGARSQERKDALWREN